MVGEKIEFLARRHVLCDSLFAVRGRAGTVWVTPSLLGTAGYRRGAGGVAKMKSAT